MIRIIRVPYLAYLLYTGMLGAALSYDDLRRIDDEVDVAWLYSQQIIISATDGKSAYAIMIFWKKLKLQIAKRAKPLMVVAPVAMGSRMFTNTSSAQPPLSLTQPFFLLQQSIFSHLIKYGKALVN